MFRRRVYRVVWTCVGGLLLAATFWFAFGWRYWPRVELYEAWPGVDLQARFEPVFETERPPSTPAREALKRPVLRVVDKLEMAPSRDPRDYVSLSIYWWPNPITYHPWLPRDGERNPAAADYDAPRLQALVRTVHELAAVGTKPADERAVEWLKAWFVNPETRMNPHLTYAQMMPGLAAGGRQGIIEGLPLSTQLLDALAWLDARDAMTPSNRAAIRQWLAEYLTWLIKSGPGRAETARPNNHGTWHDVQVAALARSLGLKTLEQETLAAARARLAAQFTQEGAQPYELSRAKSWDYSLYNLNAWRHLERLGQLHGISYWAQGPARAETYLQERAEAWPSGRVSGNPVRALVDFQGRCQRWSIPPSR